MYMVQYIDLTSDFKDHLNVLFCDNLDDIYRDDGCAISVSNVMKVPSEDAVFKVIVAGGRDFSNYEMLRQRLDYLLQNQQFVVIVSGAARGADSLGERYAKERGLFIQQFPANWNRYGKKAGYIRNKEMAQYANGLVAFWDGSSRGTKLMIELAKQYQLPMRVICY